MYVGVSSFMTNARLSVGNLQHRVAQVARNLCAKHWSRGLGLVVSCRVATLVASNQSYPETKFFAAFL